MLKHSTSVLLTLLCILAAHVQAEIIFIMSPDFSQIRGI